jgi:hypothetical protein
MVFSGPGLPRRIQIELAALMRLDGHQRIGSAIGVE